MGLVTSCTKSSLIWKGRFGSELANSLVVVEAHFDIQVHSYIIFSMILPSVLQRTTLLGED